MRQLMHSFVGTTAPPAILDGVRSGAITSFCLFMDKNVRSPAQVRALSQSLYDAAAQGGLPPPLIGIDQEGGQLMAITGGATELPGNMALGATRSPALAEAAGRVLARELLAMGVNVNFAPSLDVNVNPANPVIGVRSFGDDPALVGRLGVALLRGMQSQGVMATAKHFPGHGDVSTDTHHSDVIVSHSRARLESVELTPFRMAIAANVEAIMSAHIRATAYDSENPATVSRRVLYDLLRGELGHTGLVITDAMDMHAVARLGTVESIQAALDAGNDLILLGHIENQLALIPRFAAQENPQSVARILAARERRPRAMLPLEVVGSAEHLAVAQEIAEHSITLVKQSGRLPLRPTPEQALVVITPQPQNLTPADSSAEVEIALAAEIARRHPRTHAYSIARDAAPAELHALIAAAEQHSPQHIIVGTINATPDDAQAALVNALIERGHKPLVVSMRTPYDIIAFPRVEDYLCTYSIRALSMQAVARVLFGEIAAQGMLPCELPSQSLAHV